MTAAKSFVLEYLAFSFSDGKRRLRVAGPTVGADTQERIVDHQERSYQLLHLSQMRPLRISAISFLNTAPLMWNFEHGEAAETHKNDFDIAYTVPSLCADALRDGAADIGIIPAAEYARIPGLLILPDVAIAARGPVRSIL